MNKIFHGLHFNNIRGDIFGGITAAVVALPLALAFGVASGAGAIAGLYGAIIVGLFAALFGGTPAQVSGPTGPMTVVITAIIADYIGRFPESGLALAFTVVILGGLLQIAMGVLKLGRFISFVPFPVLSGFMSGIGIIIIILQLAPLLGHVTQKGGILVAFQNLPSVFANPITSPSILGGVTLLIVYLWPAKLGKLMPASLIALIVGTALYLSFFTESEVSILGEIPTGLPAFHMPELKVSLIFEMLKSALVLATLGSIDSLLTSLVADNKTRSHHNSDRELIGQGIGNTIAGFFWGLPGAGATMRTMINIRAGGATPISGALHSLILLAIVLGAGSLAENIPHAVLAGILVKVGADIIDWDFFKHIKNTPRGDVMIMLGVLFMTVFVDLITAVAAGVIGSSMVLLQQLSHLQLRNINQLNQTYRAGLPSEANQLLDNIKDKVKLLHIDGPIAFGATRGFVKMIDDLGTYKALLLDLTDVDFLDITATKALGDIINHHVESNLDLYLIGVNMHIKDVMQHMGLLTTINANHIVDTPLEALQTVHANYC
jgi:sulfate permease, SulP family